MNYTLLNYPHLVKVMFVDIYGMAWVSDNLTGRTFRVKEKLLTKIIKS